MPKDSCLLLPIATELVLVQDELAMNKLTALIQAGLKLKAVLMLFIDFTL